MLSALFLFDLQAAKSIDGVDVPFRVYAGALLLHRVLAVSAKPAATFVLSHMVFSQSLPYPLLILPCVPMTLHFTGKVVLVVNVASACGYTDSNYRGLQKTYEKYKDHVGCLHLCGLSMTGHSCVLPMYAQQPVSHTLN